MAAASASEHGRAPATLTFTAVIGPAATALAFGDMVIEDAYLATDVAGSSSGYLATYLDSV